MFPFLTQNTNFIALLNDNYRRDIKLKGETSRVIFASTYWQLVMVQLGRRLQAISLTSAEINIVERVPFPEFESFHCRRCLRPLISQQRYFLATGVYLFLCGSRICSVPLQRSIAKLRVESAIRGLFVTDARDRL